jgi:two-component system alkaline phosphatase synthesis response regulator PhoP
LVVDDEPGIVSAIKAYLDQEGYAVSVAADGNAALLAARDFKPDLVILDVMLPGKDGFQVLQALRRESEAYVLMLSARAQEMDKIVGLTEGADDYMTKPFSPRELMARVKALLRRARPGGRTNSLLTFAHLRIDPDARLVWKNDGPLELTTIEFDLLCALARHSGRVLSRDQIIEQVWGADFYGDDRVVDVHLGHLRRKLQDEASDSTIIATVRGAGYRFDDSPV